MKKRNIIISLAIAVICISIIFILMSVHGQKPFRTLVTEEIKEVTVELYPPNVKAELEEEDIENLVEILQEVVIYGEDNTYVEYSGQAVVYKITKTDDTVIEIQAYNPFLIIGGIGYQTKYEPCEQLNHFGNEIIGCKLR